MTPYEAVFRMKAKHELSDHIPEEDPTPRQDQTPKEDHALSTTRSQASQKQKAIQESQKCYNAKMIKKSKANPQKRLCNLNKNSYWKKFVMSIY